MKPQDSQIQRCRVLVVLLMRSRLPPARVTAMSACDHGATAGPGQEYNPGPATTPRQAATVILLRGGAETLEVLLVRRSPQARFMGGVWVFPGGAVDAGEGDGDDAHRAAGVRELREEASVTLEDPGGLVKFSRWITPAQV